MPTTEQGKNKWRQGLTAGVRKGFRAFFWMVKILVPISFATAVFAWCGWIGHLVFVMKPVMQLLHLPVEAAVPLIIGMLTNIYGAIAAMTALPFTKEQMTLMAIFVLTAHNLIQEGTIQGLSGLHPLKATAFRLAAAFFTVFCVAFFLETGPADSVFSGTSEADRVPFSAMLTTWAYTTTLLGVKIFLIIMTLLILLEVLKTLGFLERIVSLFRPCLKALGLSHRAGFLWMTAAVFGLAYGAAVIVEEAREGNLTKDELEALHLSIGINHSMVEDPTLFLSLGLSPFWLWVPRLIMAIVAVRILTLWNTFRPKARTPEAMP